MTEDEVMTGWDSPDDLEVNLSAPQMGAGKTLLLALDNYLRLHASDDVEQFHQFVRQELLESMDAIDWSAMDFTQQAIDEGQEIFSCFPTNDVLTRYNPGRPHDPDQQGFAF